MLVFRDGRETVPGPGRLQELAAILRRLSHPDPTNPVLLLDALLRAGELECALADAGAHGHMRLAALTDRLADALLGAPATHCGPETLDGVDVPAMIECSA